jgi:cytochrome oxidase assembly protein ShyY1
VGFLLTRRWVLFFLGVVVLALACVRLGQWQFHRLHDTEQANTWARANLYAKPAPVQDVLSTGQELAPERQWKRVVAEGRYDAGATVVVRYQTRQGSSGVDLVTPLVMKDGTAVLVDRGWVQTQNTAVRPTDLPAPPPGQVKVIGWARPDATGSATQVEQASTRAISSRAIGADVHYPLYRGFVDAVSETPAPATSVVRPEKPDLGNGPHLFYGIQWWFFAALAIFGFGYLAYDERRTMRGQGRTGKVEDRPVTRA